MLLGLMKAPITNLALISKEIPSSMVRTLSAYGETKKLSLNYYIGVNNGFIKRRNFRCDF